MNTMKFLWKCAKNPMQRFVLGILVFSIIVALLIMFVGTQTYVERTIRDGCQMIISGIENGKRQ
jgi:hypothetical protein